MSGKTRSIEPQLFNAKTVTREELEYFFNMYKLPFGASGTSTCRVICGLLQQIAELRGYSKLEFRK